MSSQFLSPYNLIYRMAIEIESFLVEISEKEIKEKRYFFDKAIIEFIQTTKAACI